MPRKGFIHDEVVRQTIIDLIAAGNYIKTACLAAGIEEHTFVRWMQRAERYNDNVAANPEDEVYYTFYLQVKKARQSNIALHVANIQKASAMPNHWTASAWLLERMAPAEYGKRIELELGASKVLLALREEARQSLGMVKQLPQGTTPVAIETVSTQID